VPVLRLPDDTALPACVDAFVFEQDTEYILRADLPVRYPAQSAAELIAAAGAAPGRVPGVVYPIEGAPLRLMAVVHDLAQQPSWREEWIAATYAGIARVAHERALGDLVLPLLGTVHGRFDPTRSQALLEAAMREHGIDPRLWVRSARRGA
jgi:hypothetical protein